MTRRERMQLKKATDTLFTRLKTKIKFRFGINSDNAVKIVLEEEEKWNDALKADALVIYSNDFNIS